MKSLTITLILTLTSILTFSQTIQKEDASIEKQFDDIYKSSTNYKSYKEISRKRFKLLKVNVMDSIESFKKIITEKENLLNTERGKVETTKNLLTKIKTELDVSLKKDNSTYFLGIQLSNTAYNLILWSIIILLVLGMSSFIFKFYKSNVLTKEAQENLLTVEQEFDQHRRKSLEREQKLRRQLQDEINKQRNS